MLGDDETDGWPRPGSFIVIVSVRVVGSSKGTNGTNTEKHAFVVFLSTASPALFCFFFDQYEQAGSKIPPKTARFQPPCYLSLVLAV